MEVQQFSIQSLEEMSFDVLKDSLRPGNCIELWQFTNLCHISVFLKLKNEAFHFICDHFEEVSLCKDFLQLEMTELADILDNLAVTQESTVYQCVVRWINHMPEERQGNITTLLPKVRLGLMDKSYIMDHVLNNDVVKTNPESLLLVLKILQVMSQRKLLRSEPGIDKTLFYLRLPNAVLLMVRLFNVTMETFDYSTNRWLTVHTRPSLKDPRPELCFQSAVFLDGYVYIVGGGFICGVSNRVWRFNLVTHTWHKLSPMQESRNDVSVTVLKGCIYAIGGRTDGNISLKTAERYQPDINRWTYIASMNEGRSYASCTTLNNKIYICGGRDYFTDLNTAEYYDPNTNQWTLITPMGTPRHRLGVIAYMGHIFAFGGVNRNNPLKSAEAYDPETNTWHNVSDMVYTHSGFGVAVMNKRIFVVSCRTNRRIVESFDFTTNTWSVVFVGMDRRYISIVSGCVISGLPNMTEYCSPRRPVMPSIQCYKKV